MRYRVVDTDFSNIHVIDVSAVVQPSSDAVASGEVDRIFGIDPSLSRLGEAALHPKANSPCEAAADSLTEVVEQVSKASGPSKVNRAYHFRLPRQRARTGAPRNFLGHHREAFFGG